jgi:hypothetical protein
MENLHELGLSVNEDYEKESNELEMEIIKKNIFSVVNKRIP